MGLSNLTSVGSLYPSQILILNNDALTSLTGLDNIDDGSIYNVDISDNLLLSVCAVQSICDHLASPGPDDRIYDNAIGCNSIGQVNDSCSMVGLEPVLPGLPFTIYPNPSSGFITVETPVKGSLTINTCSGQQLLNTNITGTSTTIDVSGLKNGIYFLRITGEKTVQVGKFVRQ
jgi:hypothetical protein